MTITDNLELKKATEAVEELTKKLSYKDAQILELENRIDFLQSLVDKTVAENNTLKNAIISKFLGIEFDGTEVVE